ncbi:hypothetical protein A0H81_03493 [Grifola frondosa]|uniref:Uncharacterized protein n=1 Tax=Grifola frondosa TaxID=5627 RepID=A0A1C7MNI2_GRIFR|nr:hypothetical protein A0H81_03493 [Grifola frondosa]
MLNKLINGRVGFAWGVRAAAFLTLGLLIIANFSCRRVRHISRARRLLEAPGRVSSKFSTTGTYWIATVGGFLAVLGLYIPYFYIQLFVSTHDLSPNLAFYSLAIMNASSFFGRIRTWPLGGIDASLFPAALASLSNDLSDVGIRIGVGFFITSFGLLIGNPIAGALLNPGFRWSHLIIFCGVEMLGAAAVSVVIRQMVVRQKGRQIV